MSAANDTTAPPASDLVNEVLFTADRSRGLRMEIRFIVWRGHPRIDVREHRYTGGSWRPTEKGVSIKVRELGAVIDVLTALRAKIGASR